MKITLEQLAKHHGITLSSVKKWSIEKRLQRLADMKAGVQPHITDLISELAGACYRASCYVKTNVEFSPYYFQGKATSFQVYYRKPGEDKNTWLIEPITECSTVWLCAAIAKVEGLINDKK